MIGRSLEERAGPRTRAARQFGAMAGLALAINQNERGRVLKPDPQRAEDL